MAYIPYFQGRRANQSWKEADIAAVVVDITCRKC